MAVTSSYGMPNPQALDPYPIETNLAMGTSNPQNLTALPLLAMYMSDRALQEKGYNQQLGQQHEFAQQQLLAQIAEHAAKAQSDAAQHGTLPFLAANPQTAGYLAGSTPDMVTQRDQLFQRGELGKILQSNLAASQSGFAAGTPLSAETLTQTTGVPVGTGVPGSIQVANINAEARRQAAAMRAAATNNPSISLQGPQLPGGYTANMNLGKSGLTIPQGIEMLEQQRMAMQPTASGTVGTVPGVPAPRSSVGGIIPPPPQAQGSPTTSAPPPSQAPAARTPIQPVQTLPRAVVGQAQQFINTIVAESKRPGSNLGPIAAGFAGNDPGGVPPITIISENGQRVYAVVDNKGTPYSLHIPVVQQAGQPARR